jgi:4-aminobutyrate aminotransferase-like enzyme
MSHYKFNLNPCEVPSVSTRFRKIHTQIPAPGTIEVINKLIKFESRSMHGQIPLVWDKAHNFSVYDSSGNCWIDFTSSIFIANIGHSNNKVNSALINSINNNLYSCYSYPHLQRTKYLEELIHFSGEPFKKAFLLSSGTEATEACLKLMRLHGSKIGAKKLGIISIEGNWHGRTMGAQMLSNNINQSKWIGNTDVNIYHLPFPYESTLNNIDPKVFLRNSIEILCSKKKLNLNDDICGIMIESFQGWGAFFYPDMYIKEIRSICTEYNILLCFDEMQSGFGRTGKKFGFQNYGITPDLFACGKAMGGGVPLSAVIGKETIMDLPDIGNMSSTHSANPLVCSAGIAVLEVLEDMNLVNESYRKGLILNEYLLLIKNEFPNLIKISSGKGLIAAVLFYDLKGIPDAYTASHVVERCMRKGLLLVHTGRESIKIGPPLTIEDDALIEGLNVLIETIREVL